MNQTTNQRIEIVIKNLGLRNSQVADDLDVSQAQISRIISGDRNASPRLLKDFCFQYNVNQQWLETGEGSMFNEMTRSERIAAFGAKVASLDDKDFEKRFVSMLERLMPEHWALLAEMAEMVLEAQNEEEGKHD